MAINTEPPMSNRELAGIPPPIFDGNRNETEAFLLYFRIYQELNQDAPEMRSPYKRVLLALTCIRGRDGNGWVDDWVEEQFTTLTNKVTDETANTAIDEQLWSDFVASFKSAFTSTTEQWDALVKLNTLKMERGDLDLYIATFTHLARKAGQDLNSTDTSARFVQGLRDEIKSHIVQRDMLPSTLTEWMTAAQEVHLRYARVQAEMLTAEASNQWIAVLPLVFRGANAARTIDDDRIQTALTEEQKQQYYDEGHCFHCGLRDHISRACPKK